MIFRRPRNHQWMSSMRTYSSWRLLSTVRLAGLDGQVPILRHAQVGGLLTNDILAGQATSTNRLDPFAPTEQHRKINPEPHLRHHEQGARDVTRSDAALARPSWIVLDPLLQDAKVPLPYLGDHFRVDEKIARLEVDRFQHLAAKQLE